MIQPERALFSAVIVRAIMDARGSSSAKHSSAAMVVQRQSAEWIKGGGQDFQMVCALAGIDAKSVRDAFVSGKLNTVHLETTSADCINRNRDGAA